MQADITALADYQPRDRAIESVILLGACAEVLRNLPADVLDFTVLDVDDNRISAKVAIARVCIALAKVVEGL